MNSLKTPHLGQLNATVAVIEEGLLLTSAFFVSLQDVRGVPSSKPAPDYFL